MAKKKIKLLGISYGDNSEDMWENVQKKVQDEITSLNSHKMTVKGKSFLSNTYLLSKAWYPLKIRSAPEKALRKIEREIYVFIWGGKREWLKRDSCRISTKQGGLGIRCPRIMRKMFMINQIRNIIHQPWEPWMAFFLYWLGISLRIINLGLFKKTFIHAERITNNRHTQFKQLIDELHNSNNLNWLTREQNLKYEDLTHTTLWNHKIVENNPQYEWDKMWLLLLKKQSPQEYALNFRLTHEILPLKQRLSDLGITDSNTCVFCNILGETAQHLFINCTTLNGTRVLVKEIIEQRHGVILEMNHSNILGHGIMEYNRNMTSRLLKILNCYKRTLWNARNKKIFDGTQINMLQINHTIRKETAA